MTEELKIIEADERIARSSNRTVKIGVFGEHGIGKTTLLKTLKNPEKVLFVNTDYGDLAVKSLDKNLDRKEPKTWKDCKNLICYISGPNRAFTGDEDYGVIHYERAKKLFESTTDLSKYDTVFIDSVSRISKLAYDWARVQDQSFTEEGKFNKMAAYGLLGEELTRFFYQLQFTPKNIIITGPLDKKVDKTTKKPSWSIRIDGQKGAQELPGIVDQVVPMIQIKGLDGKPYRVFVCNHINPWQVPAKTRCKLKMVMPAHLGDLIDKILNDDGEVELDFSIPEEYDV